MTKYGKLGSAASRSSEVPKSYKGRDVFTWASLFFLVGVGFSSLLANYSGALANLARFSAIGIGVLAVIIRNPKVSDLVLWLLALGISYYLSVRSGKMMVFFSAVSVVLVDGYPTRKALGVFALSAAIDLALLVAASAFGLVEAFGLKEGRRVLCLGLVSSNTVGALSFTFLCLIEYFLGPNRRLMTPLLVGYAVICLGLTGSRTPFVVSLILIALCAIFNDSWRWLRRMKSLRFAPFVFSVISVALLVLYANGNAFARYLDGPLSGRLLLNFTYNYQSLGIPLLGSAPASPYASTVDNVYLYMVFRCGLIGLTLYNVYYYFLLNKTWREEDPFLFILCLLMAAYGLTESTTLIGTCLNPALLLLRSAPCHEFLNDGKVVADA